MWVRGVPVRPVPEANASQTDQKGQCKNGADDEAACMRPISDTACIGIGTDTAEQLHPKPQAKHQPRGHGQDLEEDDEYDEYGTDLVQEQGDNQTE